MIRYLLDTLKNEHTLSRNVFAGQKRAVICTHKPLKLNKNWLKNRREDIKGEHLEHVEKATNVKCITNIETFNMYSL